MEGGDNQRREVARNGGAPEAWGCLRRRDRVGARDEIEKEEERESWRWTWLGGGINGGNDIGGVVEEVMNREVVVLWWVMVVDGLCFWWRWMVEDGER